MLHTVNPWDFHLHFFLRCFKKGWMIKKKKFKHFWGWWKIFCLSSKKWKQFSKCSAATSVCMWCLKWGMHTIILIVFFCKWVSLFISHTTKKWVEWDEESKWKWKGKFYPALLLYAITQVCQLNFFFYSRFWLIIYRETNVVFGDFL